MIKAAMERAGLEPGQVEEVVFAQQYRTGELPANMARPISVDAGIPIPVPNFTVAKACGGSLKTVFLAAQAVKAGDAQVLVAGGLEHMTNAGYLLTKARWGYRLGHGQLMDQLVLFDSISGNTMGETAENVAEKYQINRADQDAFALESQKKAGEALKLGLFDGQIVPVPVPQSKGKILLFKQDEHPRPETTLEDLAKLKPVFRSGGSVTAGNSSGMNDGASALVVASRDKARDLGLKPLVSIVGYAWVGVESPPDGHRADRGHPAALEKDGLSLSAIDLVELDEGPLPPRPWPASGSWDWIRKRSTSQRRGHCPGASHQRYRRDHPDQAHLELRRSGKELGLATMCLGGGQGVAIIVRNEG